MKKFLTAFYAVTIAMLISSLAFGVDIKSQIGTQDLNLDSDNATHGTFQRRTSTGGSITLDKIDGNQIPWSNAGTGTIRPKHIIGPGTGNISGYDNGTFTGRLSAPSIGSASYTDNGYFADLITRGPWVDVRSITGVACDNTTDDYAGLQAYVTAMPNGTHLFWPNCTTPISGELNFSGKRYIQLTGLGPAEAGTYGSGIRYIGNSDRSAVWMVGANDVIIRDLEISSQSSTPPQVVLALGRKDSGSYGWHVFDNLKVYGYATKALVYSIASEVNRWERPHLTLVGGGAKYVFYTSQSDDLSVGGFTASTNLSLFMNHFWLGNLSTDNSAATIYIKGGSSTGDMYFTKGSGSSSGGSHVEINVVMDNVSNQAIGVFSFENIRMEPSIYGTPFYGIKGSLSGPSPYPGAITQLSVKNINFYQDNAVIYGEDNLQFYNFNMAGVHQQPGYSGHALDIYNLQEGTIRNTFNSSVNIRNSSENSTFMGVGTVTIAVGHNNIVQAPYPSEGITYTGTVTLETRYYAQPSTWFFRYYGTTAADNTYNISTATGTDNVVGPKSGTAGWSFIGMIRQNVNGTDYWMPYYSYTP